MEGRECGTIALGAVEGSNVPWLGASVPRFVIMQQEYSDDQVARMCLLLGDLV